MLNQPNYLDRFIDALRFLAKTDKAYRKTSPDFDAIRNIISQNLVGKLRSAHDEVGAKLLKPMAENYLKRVGDFQQIANRCHGLSHGFRETWESMEIGRAFPLQVTIGNVYHRNIDIYGVSKSSLKRILSEGRCNDRTLDVHVWLTWDDMTIVDLSILSTLARREVLLPPDDGSKVLIWNGNNPGDFWFEPLLVDNDFFNKVDDGCLIHPGM